MSKMKGKFITFEGGEGSGKGTQIKLLIEVLKKKGYEVVSTNEPGATEAGLKIRELLLSPKTKKLCSEAETFLFMADRTGTLWENIDERASCNNGFASHMVHTLFRDVLGIYRIDMIDKVVHLRFTDLHLNWCEGSIPLKEGNVELKWRKENKRILYSVNIPVGYSLRVDNLSGTTITMLP